MALGATGPGLLRLVIFEGLKMAGVGIAIGLLLVFALAQTLSHNDFGIEMQGPEPLFAAISCIAVFTLLACWFPAWRATLLSPLIAIRNEPGSMWEQSRERHGWLTRRVSILAPHTNATAATETALLSEMADSGRSAGSFAEAIDQALATLRERIQAEWTMLLVQAASDQPFNSGSASLPSDSLLLNRLRNYHVGLPISREDLDALRAWAQSNAPQRLPEIETLRNIAPAVAVPVTAKTGITGILLLGPATGRNEYSSLEKRLLMSVASQLALMIENARLTDRIVEQEFLRRELLVASEVQKRLFPEHPPDTKTLQLAGFCLPARGVGGDYYDFLNLGDHRIGIALADVAGKGIAAALVMSVVQASLRSLADGNGNTLAELTGKLNRLLQRSTGPSSYATFFYAQFDEETRQLRYVNAGHNPPYLLHNGNGSGNARIEELSTGGMIIGMFPQSAYEEGLVQLHPGDTLMLFTDGVSEAHDPQQEEFGDDRLKDLLHRTAHLPIEEMSARILVELRAWMSNAPQHDDLTFVLMKVL